MGGFKTDHQFEVNEDQLTWLHEMVEKYRLPDDNKALRIVLDHAMSEVESEALFTPIRCHHC